MAYTQPPTRSSVDQILSADWNTYVRANFIEVESRKELQYIESAASASVNVTTVGTAATVLTANAFTPDGTSYYKIEFGCADVQVGANAGGNSIIFHLFEDGTARGRIGILATGGTTQLDAPVRLSREFIPTNASHTYSIRAHRTNAVCTVVHGAGGSDVLFPYWMTITRMP